MVGKKASVKVIEYCSKLTGKTFKASSSWAELSEVFLEGYVYDLKTGLETTKIVLYKEPGEKENLVESWNIPNDEIFDKKQMDWDWNYIWKMLAEYIMKQRKPRAKKVKKLSYDELKKQVSELRDKIKTSKGSEKRKLIQEYNSASKELEKFQEKHEEQNNKKEQAKQEVANIKKRVHQLYMKIRYEKNRGRDASELEKEYQTLKKKLNEM